MSRQHNGAGGAGRWRSLWKWALAGLIAVAGVVSLGLVKMSREDAEHALFYDTGASVKSFLGHYCAGLREASEAGSPAPLEGYYADDFRAVDGGHWVFSEPDLEGGVEVRQLGRSGSESVGKAERLAGLADYLDGLSEILVAECKIYLIEEAVPRESAQLTVRFIVDATDVEGLRIQDRHFYRWFVERRVGPDGEPDWRIVGDEVVSGTRTSGGGAFDGLDPVAAGIDYRHRRDPKLDREQFYGDLKFDVMQHASGGISAADYDGDGRSDLFFVDGVESRLYRNVGLADDGRPRFADRTAEAGLEGIDQAHAALFFDLENDGDRDLFVTRYLAPSRLYRNEGQGVFVDASTEMGLDFVAPASSATVLDYDRDGFLDLYVGVYGNAFEAVPRLPFFARNGGSNRLYRNEAGTGFTDVSAASGTGDTGWSLAVAAGDVDGDSWPDLAVANDFGRKRLYRNNGDGSFTDIAPEAGVLDFSGGMGVTFGDYDNDGLQDIYTSNIYSNQRWYGEDRTIRQYLRNVFRTRWAVLDFGEFWDLRQLIGNRWHELGHETGEGNGVFHNQGDGTFEERKGSAASFAGWSWSVAFFDYDNDADLDLYAANGWITATPGTDL